MGLFDFARDAGDKLRGAVGRGKPDVEAQDLADALRQKGVTIQNGKISVDGDKVTITGQANSQQEKELAILILGNTKGVAKVDDQITIAQGQGQPGTGAAAAQPTFYTVKPGDTLSKIAKQAYGDANRYPEIFEANRPMLSDPDEIYPGQSLRIPGATIH